MSKANPTVFISSTCDDLADLRAELSDQLVKDGFTVRLSEDTESGFRVDPGANAIESCLENVRQSDIVLFIFDRRYGNPISEYGGLSAVHLEFSEARKGGKGFLNFIRAGTVQEYNAWAKAGRPEDDSEKCKLFGLIRDVITLRKEQGHNNWYQEFKSSPDLRRLIMKRLQDEFKGLAGGRALTRERVVRLHFKRGNYAVNQLNFQMEFRICNAGLNVAVDLEVTLETNEKAREERLYEAVVAVGESSTMWFEEIKWVGTHFLICRYANLWGDRYEIRVPIVYDILKKDVALGKESFRVVEPSDRE